MMSPQCRVGLSMLVQVRRMRPASVVIIEQQHHALPNIDEHADRTTAPGTMLETAALLLVVGAADC